MSHPPSEASPEALAEALQEAEFVSSFANGSQLHFLATKGFFEGAKLASLRALHAKWAADPLRVAHLHHPAGLEVLGRLLASAELREQLKNPGVAAIWDAQLAAYGGLGSPLPQPACVPATASCGEGGAQ